MKLLDIGITGIGEGGTLDTIAVRGPSHREEPF
jgi:hypothetical protein